MHSFSAVAIRCLATRDLNWLMLSTLIAPLMGVLLNEQSKWL